MKIAVIMGTRPEIIRLYHTVKALPDKTIYWTGQNFAKNLSTDIFEDPLLADAYTEVVMLSTFEIENFAGQFAIMIESLADELLRNRPDKVLILGDTNSSLAGALIAKKLGLPLYHMEAGNRCYDPNSPEEVNRKMIDSIADVHMCYTQHAKQNLLAEGVPQNRIHVIGNPIAEFTTFHEDNLSIKNHILVTCHRQENQKYIKQIIAALRFLGKNHKIIACIHPRYNDYFRGQPGIETIPSVSFSHFISLEKRSKLIITDSGTVCEEAALLNIPCLIIRRTMERPELFDIGSCILTDVANGNKIVEDALELLKEKPPTYILPDEYWYPNPVSQRVKNIVLGKGNYI